MVLETSGSTLSWPSFMVNPPVPLGDVRNGPYGPLLLVADLAAGRYEDVSTFARSATVLDALR